MDYKSLQNTRAQKLWNAKLSDDEKKNPITSLSRHAIVIRQKYQYFECQYLSNWGISPINRLFLYRLIFVLSNMQNHTINTYTKKAVKIFLSFYCFLLIFLLSSLNLVKTDFTILKTISLFSAVASPMIFVVNASLLFNHWSDNT